MTSTDELARAWASARDLDPSPGVLAMASRRVRACGRLATIAPLLHVAEIVRTDVLEHGGAYLMAEGTAYARIYVDAADPEQLQRIAEKIHRSIREAAWPEGLLLVASVHQATRWDRLRAWWAERRS